MPKIALLNTESGKLESFEPVDAREIMATPGTIYTVPSASQREVGLTLEPGQGADINIPQLQGEDAEMQTGLSVNKYGRSQAVKAEPGNPEFAPVPPTPAQTSAALSDGLKVDELRAELEKRGVEIPDGAKKADLQALLDSQVG